MKFNVKKFKNNISFFVISGLLLVIFILLGIFKDKNSNSLEKKELDNKETSVKSLVINEIMTGNNGTIASFDGGIYDYLELYNGSDKDIELKDYGLGDENNKVKWVFPKTTIKAKSYIVVFLSGKKLDGLNASFKLKSSGGEVVSLFRPNGKVIDAVKTVSLDSGSVMARDENGLWVIENPTPGFTNNLKGHKEFLKSLMAEGDSDLKINEILANNKGNFKNKNGEYSGYIEIINVSNKSINLENYSLSNDVDCSFKWQFPNRVITPGETLVIYTSGTSSKKSELSTGFKLKSKNGYAVLSNNKGKVIDRVEYNNLGNGMAYVRTENGFAQSSNITPGYPNTVDGQMKFQSEYIKTPKDLIINEAMNSNYEYLPQNGGNYYDWIELYNNSNKTIKLSDYCLTTSTNSICEFKLPKIELKKGEYYIVMASGETNLSNDSYVHAPFKLSSVEGLYLTKDRKIIDTLFISEVPSGYSIGKSDDGIYYFSKPTPKAKNSNGTMSISYLPTANKKSGIYNNIDSIEVALTGGDKIYYTLDGSVPTTSSKVYSSPLTIKKTTVLRTMSKDNGKLQSKTNTYSYIMNENHKINVMSISIDKKALSNVNTHTALNSSVIEPCFVEYFDSEGTGFSIGAGLKLFGGSTRSYKKKSYEIKFKKKYGEGSLKYKVFDTVDSSVFDSLVLRTGSQDEFEWSKKTLIRDIVATSLVAEYTDVDVQAYKPVALYLNGEYWGLYFIREKVDESFISNHYNVKATKENTDLLRIDGEVKIGTNTKYNKMVSFTNSNTLSDVKNYNKIKEQIDIVGYCDFWISEIWPSNYDIVNMRYFSNPLVDSGKWKFIYYDLDSAFYNVDVNYYKYYTTASGIGYGNFPTTLLRNLLKSSEFKKTFVERLSYNLKNTWNSDNVIKKIDSVIDEISEDEIKRNLSRWNVASYDEWKSNVSSMKNFARKRNKYMVSQAKSFFGLSNSDMNKYFGDVK